MRVILLGRKPIACAALRHMLSRGIEVVAVAAPGKAEPDPYPERLADVAESFDIPVVQDTFLYDCLAGAQTAPSLDFHGSKTA
jgi:methionyl-tRNA formyltransferase